jgi:mannose/fructose/N-acetylgalactosamine-specific phosphotransferase system component IID
MKNLKKLLTIASLLGIIIIGTSVARAGIIVSFSETTKDSTTSCEEVTETKVDNGIIVSLTGIIVSLTGIIVSFSDTEPIDCGIIVSKN